MTFTFVRYSATSHSRLFARIQRTQLRYFSQSFSSQPVHEKVLFQSQSEGTLGTRDYRVYLRAGDCFVSPWHEIPLIATKLSQDAPRPSNKLQHLLHKDTLLHYVNEIPMDTRQKFEIDLKLHNNPIRQDIKNNTLRVFGAGDVPFNYGALPQTWENPEELFEDTGFYGDGDPLDAVEISPQPKPVGEVSRVRVLGVLALIDQCETDWKVIVIDSLYPMTSLLNKISDLDSRLLKQIREWFRVYKLADGGDYNQFAFNGEFRDRDYACRVIDNLHKSWIKKQCCET